MGKKILCINWNTESIRFCESLDEKVVEKNRESYFGNWLGSYTPNVAGITWLPCEMADFMQDIIMKIQENNYKLIVISFQEDAYPGSYLHSHLLPEEMGKIGYSLLKRTKLIGTGVTTYKSTIEGDIPKGRGLRTSLYVPKISLNRIIEAEKNLRSLIGNKAQDEHLCSSAMTRGKGATASYFKFSDNEDIIAIINCHLPFNSSSLKISMSEKDPIIRQTALFSSNTCFNKMYQNLVLNKISEGILITHVIMMGDFNYRIWKVDKTAKPIIEDMIFDFFDKKTLTNYYKNNDELLSQMKKGNIYEFNEGVNNEGPMFPPTCKVSKGRDPICNINKSQNVSPTPDCWKLGKWDQRVPSWCDRILYKKTRQNSNNELVCTSYERFDYQGIMSQSDHAGVFAEFEFI